MTIPPVPAVRDTRGGWPAWPGETTSKNEAVCYEDVGRGRAAVSQLEDVGAIEPHDCFAGVGPPGLRDPTWACSGVPLDPTTDAGYALGMAKIVIDGDELAIRLSTLEKLGALSGDVHVPLQSIKSVRVSATPWRELRGFRAPGTGIPGVIMLGTARGSFGKDFCAVYGRKPVLIMDLQGSAFSRLLVSTEQPERDLEHVSSVLG